ncbi:hypothetical protein D3C81_2203650 [compost metagenome]
MLRAEWFIAAAIDWLSSATSISRVWIVGLSTDDTNPTTKTSSPSVTIQKAKTASRPRTTTRAASP